MTTSDALSISLVVANLTLAFVTALMVIYIRRSAVASERAVQEMETERKERNEPQPYLMQHRSEGWPFSLDFLLYLRIDAIHEKAHAQWKDKRWNIIIIRNVGRGETGPGEVTDISYIGQKPDTTLEDDLEGFKLRSILPGESFAKLFSIQDKNLTKEDTPHISFKYKCEKIATELTYPPKGKENGHFFIEVFPEKRVRIVDSVKEDR